MPYFRKLFFDKIEDFTNQCEEGFQNSLVSDKVDESNRLTDPKQFKDETYAVYNDAA